MIERREIRLKEMTVAIGAPMKPRRIGSGPQTGWKYDFNHGIRNKEKNEPRR
jgi:hypothetical protein